MSYLYELPNLTLTLKRLTPEDITGDAANEVSRTNLQLITDSYAEEFEVPPEAASATNSAEKLPLGTVAGHFRPYDDAKTAANRQYIEAEMAEGAEFWHGLVNGAVVALGKVNPTHPNLVPSWLDIRRNLYVRDVIVTPSLKRNHIGTTLLLGMLQHAEGYSSRAKVVVDVAPGSVAELAVAAFGLGYRRSADALQIGDYSLTQHQYETPRSLSKGRLITALEEHVFQRDEAETTRSDPA
jgi:hypothetical protein